MTSEKFHLMLQILELEALVPYFALTTYWKNLNNMPKQKVFKNTTFVSALNSETLDSITNLRLNLKY